MIRISWQCNILNLFAVTVRYFNISGQLPFHRYIRQYLIQGNRWLLASFDISGNYVLTHQLDQTWWYILNTPPPRKTQLGQRNQWPDSLDMCETNYKLDWLIDFPLYWGRESASWWLPWRSQLELITLDSINEVCILISWPDPGKVRTVADPICGTLMSCRWQIYMRAEYEIFCHKLLQDSE